MLAQFLIGSGERNYRILTLVSPNFPHVIGRRTFYKLEEKIEVCLKELFNEECLTRVEKLKKGDHDLV